MAPAHMPDEQTVIRDAPTVEKPRRYKVLLLNDHYTTMEFVIMTLQRIFHKTTEDATRIMLAVHRQGMGVAGVYVKDIAEMKCEAVHALAHEHGFPLRCTTEPE